VPRPKKRYIFFNPTSDKRCFHAIIKLYISSGNAFENKIPMFFFSKKSARQKPILLRIPLGWTEHIFDMFFKKERKT